ncbi:MAG: ABC transporter ATP-binding protein [Planctomycetota bacterium]
MSPSALEFAGVSKWYGQVAAITEVSLRIGPGVTGLVGQNGAGKSTLMKLACGLLRPSLGQVRVNGGSPDRVATRRQIGFCPDLDRFYERLSGRRFVTWMLRASGLGRSAAATRAGEVLERLGLADAMDRQIRGYSKGMRQRVKLALTLAHEPAVVLLDEPLTGLDPVARHEVGELVRGLGHGGAAVLVSSHVLHELQAFADLFVLMHQGRIVAEGALAELRAQLAERPRRLALRSDQPRRLARRLCELDQVSAVEIDARGVVIETTGGAQLSQRLTALGAESGLVRELLPLDDSLEAVFGYLVES